VRSRSGGTHGSRWPCTTSLKLEDGTDAAGTVVGSQAYTPFGVPTDRLGTFPSPLGYTGEMNGAFGLQYLRARWYDPATGRFTQVDPFPGLLHMPGTQHPYAYALNNPLRYTDPSGESVLATLGIIGGSALIAGAGELLFNQLPAIVNHYGGYQGVLKAVRCVGLDSILGMIDRGAVVGAMTNVIVAGLVAAAAVWAIPIVIAGLPLSGLGAVGVSLGLHWLYGGLAGFMGGMTGAMVKAAFNRQPIVYTAKMPRTILSGEAHF
jgi:RHS repeat-associated protein